MCGLGAIYNLGNKPFESFNELETMMSQVKYRGPDSYQKYFSENIILGHRRLSIIDLDKSANQPFFWKNKYVLIFNGAIYNYLEIKKELQVFGYKFQTSSDTEVLIAAYEQWGEICLKKFNGMWSFLIWDIENEKIFASRDRFGIKPLYWSKKNEKIFFASEIKQLRSIGLGCNPNYDEISKFVYSGMIGTTQETCFEGIMQIPAGHNLIINKNKEINLNQWYDLKKETLKVKTHNDVMDILYDSIKLRTRSDVDLGILLSGGIDSSLLTINLDKIRSKYKVFHGSTTEEETNETAFAYLVSKFINKQLIITRPSSEEFWGNLKKVIHQQDEPFGSTSIFMQYFVMEDAKKQNCKVILDGQGADEICLGYKRYMVLPIFYFLKNFKLMDIFKSILFVLKRNSNLTFLQKLQYVFGQYLSELRTLRARKRMHFIKLSSKKIGQIYKEISKSLWNINSLQFLEIYKYSLPSLLRFADRNSMFNSIELRVPYLDHRFVEKCFAMPLENKIRDGWDKYIFRRSNILPNKIAWRQSKLGFASPSKTWINKYSFELLDEISNSEFLKNISDINELELSWRKLNNNEKWRLFNLAIWSKTFFDFNQNESNLKTLEN